MTLDAGVAIKSWAVHVPGVALVELIPGESDEPACAPESAGDLLGGKGLLYKEPATRMALCAVHRALGLPPRFRCLDTKPDRGTAVIASSNFGNLGTICRIVRTLRDGGLRDVSPLDAPNASSNIIASTVAIWFRCGGPNFMVCSGATSGLDAVKLAAFLLRARRCERAVVVGSEPDDEVAAAFHRGGKKNGSNPLRAGAAALVLERVEDAPAGTPVAGPVRAGANTTGAAVVVGPHDSSSGNSSVIDLTSRLGDLSGALGVLQVSVAAAIASRMPTAERAVAVLCGDQVDGWQSLWVR